MLHDFDCNVFALIHPLPNLRETTGCSGGIAQLLDRGFRDDMRAGEGNVFPTNLHESQETSPPRTPAHLVAGL